MKKKTFRDELVTKGYLTDQLADFSEGLINQIDNRMDRKLGQVESKLDGRIDQVESKLDRRIDQVESKLDEKFDRVYVSLDKVIKELSDIREESSAGELQSRRLKKKVEDHENRIKKLESVN